MSQNRWSAAGPAPLFEGRPRVFPPASNGGFVALAGAPSRLLRGPANCVAQATHMDGMVGDATLQANHRGDPATSPDLSAKAIGFGPLVQEHGQPRQLLGGQPAWSTGAWTLPEGLRTPFAGTFPPL